MPGETESILPSPEPTGPDYVVLNTDAAYAVDFSQSTRTSVWVHNDICKTMNLQGGSLCFGKHCETLALVPLCQFLFKKTLS